jgi:FkbM family methyltransferase
MAGVAVLSGALLAMPYFRPVGGYRLTLAQWISPRVGTVEVSDLLQRKADFMVDYYGFTYRGNTGNFIDAHVYYFGAYEKPEIYFVRDTLAALPPGQVLVDVGANTGLYSLFASKYAATVHAVEPFPPVLDRLNNFVAENQVKNVVVHPVGLGATEARLPFFSPPDRNLGSGSFLSGFKKFAPANRDEQLTLQIVAGDAYFAPAGITRVDFIKMDIEGFERAALAGLRETLRRHRPIMVVETSIDPSVEGLFRSMEEIRAAMPEKYEFLQIDYLNQLTGAYQLQPVQSSFDRQDQFNLVAWPVEKASLVPRHSDGDSLQATP